MYNIMITGATGFLGSHLVTAIIEKTNYNIIILKRSFSNNYRIDDLINNPRIRFYDIDKISIERIFIDNRINLIIHTATEYGRNQDSCYKVLETNLMFPIKLIENAIKYGTEAFINTDSYFNKDNLSYSYLMNYSLSKKSILMWLNKFSTQIKIVNVILEHIYGENDNPDKFVEQMIRQIAIEEKKEIGLTPGDQQRDFIYVKDVVDAYLKIIEFTFSNKFRFKNFNVGTAKATSIKEFVVTVKKVSKSHTLLNFNARTYRHDEIMYSCADIIELENINWSPKYSIENGIKEILFKYKKEV